MSDHPDIMTTDQAARYIDVPAAIKAHNQKCWDQGYVKRSMEVAA